MIIDNINIIDMEQTPIKFSPHHKLFLCTGKLPFVAAGEERRFITGAPAQSHEDHHIPQNVHEGATPLASSPRLSACEGQRTAGNVSSPFPAPGCPAGQGNSTAGLSLSPPWAAGQPGPNNHRQAANPAHLDPQWLRVEQALNSIAATAVERRVAALLYRQRAGSRRALQVVQSFRTPSPNPQLALFGGP